MEKEGIKGKIYKHITLFSILGLFTIVLNNYISYVFGIELNNWFLPVREFAVPLNFFVGVMFIIFFVGYMYKYANSLFKDSNASIAEASLNCFVVFVKMLPVFMVWNLYLVIAILLGLLLFRVGSVAFALYFALLILITIFVNFIYVMYAKDLKLNSKYFSVCFLVNIMRRNFTKVINVTFRVLVYISIIVYVLYKVFLQVSNAVSIPMQLSLKLFILCTGNYLITLFYYNYIKRLVLIAKESDSI